MPIQENGWLGTRGQLVLNHVILEYEPEAEVAMEVIVFVTQMSKKHAQSILVQVHKIRCPMTFGNSN